jgi:cation transport regulator ChaC
MFLYFAYGSVLSRRHVGEWAGEHGVDARLFARGAPAVLRGYSLTFDVESRFWGGRVANLREDKDGVVHGVLFEIPVPARDAVLKKEGVATGLSQEIDVTVEVDGKPVRAKAFVARPEKRTEPGPASGRLLQYLVEGAQERGLPQPWIDELKRHAAAAAPTTPAPGPVGLKVDLKRGT